MNEADPIGGGRDAAAQRAQIQTEDQPQTQRAEEYREDEGDGERTAASEICEPEHDVEHDLDIERPE